MTTVKDITNKIELLGGEKISHEQIKRGDYLIVVQTNGGVVSGFCITGNAKISAIPSQRTKTDFNIYMERISLPEAATKMVVKKLDIKYHGTWGEFLNKGGKTVQLVKSRPNRHHSRRFFDFWEDEPLYRAPEDSELREFLKTYL